MSSYSFLVLQFIHFVADFCFQTSRQAAGKSISNRELLEHVFTYTLVLWLFYGWRFALITFIAHFITDWNTSRITKSLWASQDIHMFFVVIGFDQFLHTVQLVMTYTFLEARPFL